MITLFVLLYVRVGCGSTVHSVYMRVSCDNTVRSVLYEDWL